MAGAAALAKKPVRQAFPTAPEWAGAERYSAFSFDFIDATKYMTAAEIRLCLHLQRMLVESGSKRGVVAELAEFAERTGDSKAEVVRASKHLAEVGLLRSERSGKRCRYSFNWDRVGSLTERPKPRYGYVAPEKPKPEAPPKEPTPQPAELTCPLGAPCPVDRMVTRGDGVLVNLLSPPLGGEASTLAARFSAEPHITEAVNGTSGKRSLSPVITMEDGKRRTKGERSLSPVITIDRIHEQEVYEEKAKIERLRADPRWQPLCVWMTDEGKRRGRCGRGPFPNEVDAVLAELKTATLAELADNIEPKLRFMRRYSFIVPFARECAKAAELHTGNGKRAPAALTEAERLRAEAHSLLLQADAVWDDAPDYAERLTRLKEFERQHPAIVAAVRAELPA